MRVTKETQEKTRQDLLEAARDLFRGEGFAAATTRAIAAQAGIATGTLFNYFASKEALGAAVLEEALQAAQEEFESRQESGSTSGSTGQDESLEERLFAFVACQLRHLKPFRAWAREVLELEPSRAVGTQPSPRARHLEQAERWLIAEGHAGDIALELHLYWTLVLGVFSFWSRDATRNQEATLALLDRSMSLFCRGLREQREG